MKKVKFIIGALLLFLALSVSLMVTGCGIPQSELDAVNAAKDALQTQLNAANAAKDALQTQLDAVNAAKDILQAQLDTTNAAGDALQAQLDAVNAAKDALQTQLNSANAAKDALQAQLDELNAVYPLHGFDTLSEFKDWILAHVQPETQYIDDAFLAAYKV